MVYVSGSGIKCVLTQSGKVISYASRKLKDRKLNYGTHDLKLAAIIYVSKFLRR